MRGQASLSGMRPVCAVLALLSVVTVLVCLRLEVTLLADLRPTVSIELDFRHNDEPQTFPLADSYQLDVQPEKVQPVPLADALEQEVFTRHEPPILRGVFNEDDLPARETWTSGRHLIISYYEGQYSSARHQEVQGVIKENLSNEYLKKVHVLLQDVTLEDPFVLELMAQWAERLVLVRLQQADHQPTYEDLFGYANHVLGRGTVAIVSNVDVVLGKTISCVREVTPENKAMFNQTMKRIILSPSRHPAPCGVRLGEWNECFKYRGSHDSFIFAPPLSSAVIGRMDFVQNLLGAENRLLSELRTEGYRLTNPCRVVRLTHRHCVRHSRKVQTKRFARRGDGRYASVDPISLFKCGDVIY